MHAGDLEPEHERREAVAVAAVDRLLRGPERGERLAALVHVVELRAHHRAENPAPSVGREDADDGDAGRFERGAARHGHPERERARAADDLGAVEGGVHAVELEVLQPALGPLLIRPLTPEVVDDRVRRIAQLLDILDGPDLH